MRLKKYPPVFLLASIVFYFAFGFFFIYQARADIKEGEYRSAVTAYTRAARLFFWRGDLWEQAALAALQAEDLSSAIYYFERAERSPKGELALAYAYYQLQDWDSAQRVFASGAQKYSQPDFYEGLAVLFHAQKKWNEERLALENQIALDASDARAHYRLGALLTLLEPDLALQNLMRAASLDPHFDSAVQTLRAALNSSAVEPDESNYRVTLGRALGLVNEWALASASFEKAIALNEKNAEAWAWLGEAKQQRGEEGRGELERAIELDDASPVIHALNGLSWSRQGEYQKAFEAYSRAAELDPQNPAWQASLGETYWRMGDLVAALQAYQRAAELSPQEAEYWRLLASFCAENGVDVEGIALPAAEKAAELAPDDADALDTLGFVYYSTRRYATAQKILLDVIARYPQHYSAHIHLAMNYLAQGNAGAAQMRLTFVREADPNGEYGLLAQRMLETYFK